MAGKTYIGNNSDLSVELPSILIGDDNGLSKDVQKIYVGNDNNRSVKVWPNQKVPLTYQQVEYIRNSGSTQYLDPNIYPDMYTTTLIDFEIVTNSNGTNRAYILGCNNEGRVNSSDSNRTFTYEYNIYSSAYRDYYYGLMSYGGIGFSNMGGSYNFAQSSIAGRRHTVKMFAQGGELYFDDVLRTTVTATFSNEYAYLGKSKKYARSKMLIFACEWMNLDYNNTIAIYDGELKLYHFAVWQQGVLIRDMYPCYRKSDYEIGMYDLVNDKFYTNAGTGIFYKGPNV